MSTEAAFLRALQTQPDDNVGRLVFADWLDENGDPDWAEFIRLQVELEPFQVPQADLCAELWRNQARGWTEEMSDGVPAEWHALKRRFERERKLRTKRQRRWLGTAAQFTNLERIDNWDGDKLQAEFRRGFVHHLTGPLDVFLAQHARLTACCPLLRQLTVINVDGRGQALAQCPLLANIEELALVGWPNGADLHALTQSPYVGQLKQIRLWCAAPEQWGDYENLLRTLPQVETLTLVQFQSYPADAVEYVIKGPLPTQCVVAKRPYLQRFPLDGAEIGYEFYAGQCTGSPAVLISMIESELTLHHFDNEGVYLRFEAGASYPTIRQMLAHPNARHLNTDQQLLAALNQAIEFVPRPIFVRPFSASSSGMSVHWLDGYSADNLYDPDNYARIHHWLRQGNFVIGDSNDYWADHTGRIHAS